MMTELSHERARQYLLAQADGMLAADEKQALAAHLRSCDSCRKEAQELQTLHAGLQADFKKRWDSLPLPARPAAASLFVTRPLIPRLINVGVNLSLFALWAWLYRAVFDYLKIIFSSGEFRTNQLLLVGVLVLVTLQYRKENWRLRIDALPQVHWLGLTLAIGGSACYLLVERFLDINTLSASLFGLATYGLLGLWMTPWRWSSGLPAALLLIGVLPFGDHLQTFVGYPMRIAAAQIVQQGLGYFGIHSVTVDTILVMESGLAQIDLPCSGVKSLWTGALFLVAATWIERRMVNLRWIGVAALTAVMLFLANVTRVAVLVMLDQVMGWPFVAELFHVPLGVLAFTLVCIAALFMLQKLPLSRLPSAGAERITPDPVRADANVRRPNWLALALALAIASMALLYQPYPHAAAAQADIRWEFSPGFAVQESPLSPEQSAWVTQDGSIWVSRWNFSHAEGGAQVSGSILFLTSSTWRGQHKPERCFEVQGQKVEGSQTIVFEEGFPARFLYLSAGPVQASALYWLQAGDRVTDDFATRIWADLTPDNQRWVLVTVLLDDVYEIDDPAVRGLADDLRAVVANSLKGELP